MTDLPAGREMRRLKTVALLRTSNVDKKKVDGEAPVRLCNYTDVYYSETIASADGFMEATATPEEIARFQLRKDDVLVTKDSESRDDIAVPAYVARDLPGVLCGYHLALLRPRKEVVDGRFLHYCFLEGRVAHQFTVGANGITRFGLSQDVLNDARLPVPPLPIQRAVASFLDQETEKIDTLVEKKRRLLELLEEKRTALITRAVTKGLDPDVPMKDSGVEWLGEVPEHWEVVKLRRIARVVDCKHKTPTYIPNGHPLVSTTEVKPGHIDLNACTRFVDEEDFADMSEGPRLPGRGDIIYSRNASLGAAALVTTEDPFCMGQDVVLIRPDMESAFLNHQLNSPVVTRQVEAVGVGSTFSRINVGTIRDLVVAAPPREEQEAIARALENRSEELAGVREAMTHAISLLQEYRTALICAAVTGKIDVTTESAA